MACKACGSESGANFMAEIAIHFRGLKNIDEPHLWILPELWVCFSCGLAEFAVHQDQLRLLAKP